MIRPVGLGRKLENCYVFMRCRLIWAGGGDEDEADGEVIPRKMQCKVYKLTEKKTATTEIGGKIRPRCKRATKWTRNVRFGMSQPLLLLGTQHRSSNSLHTIRIHTL